MSAKIPSTLSQYLRLKAKEYEVSETELSKMIFPGSSGSLISCITFDERNGNKRISEKKINKIAYFFKDNPIMLTFMAGKIPKCVYELIIKNKDLQILLLEMLDKTNVKWRNENKARVFKTILWS